MTLEKSSGVWKVPKHCAADGCERTFVPKRPHGRFCSKLCQERAQRRRLRPPKRTYLKVVSSTGTAKRMPVRPQRVARVWLCADCGKTVSWGAVRCIGCVRRQRELEVSRGRAAYLAKRVEEQKSAEREFKALSRAERRHKKPVVATDGQRLTEKQKSVLRILQIMEKPVSARDLWEIFSRLPTTWVDYTSDAMRTVLRTLEARGMVQRAQFPRRRIREPKFVWFVPAAGRQTTSALSLDDALKESELARLIAEQEREMARGAWAQTDFKTISIDAPFDPDGGSFHDLLESGDDTFESAFAGPSR